MARISDPVLWLAAVVFIAGAESAVAADTVVTARPVPATRPEMKELLEDMKQRSLRIPLPELTEEERAELGERSGGYESRLRYHYLPRGEGSVFGGSARQGTGSGRNAAGPGRPPAPAERRDFSRNADENMSLSYSFKTMLFWIVSRTNNCQYCLGHQEQKLAAAGLTEDGIAALDSDWKYYSEAEQAAFAYARLLTFEPHLLSDDAIEAVHKFYTPLQILEMTMSMAGNNAINRWKEGTGVPQSASNSFARRGEPTGGDNRAADEDTFLTPTSGKYQQVVSIVAPLDLSEGRPTGRAVSTRPPLEPRDEVLEHLSEAASRSSRLPLVDETTAAAWLKENGYSQPVSNWHRLVANFPSEGLGRLASLTSRTQQTGDLTELQKAQVNWIAARQDRAWYATGQARKHLLKLGQSDDQIFALDGDWQEFSEADQSLFRFARNLAASPIALTDQDAEEALRLTGPRHVVQLINHVTSCAYFNRVTEAAGLPVD